MPIPQNKAELLVDILQSYQKLDKDIARIGGQQAIQKTMPGHAKGTMMSPYQLLAYLVGWADLVIDWNTKMETNQVVNFPTEHYKWNELGALAQKFYGDYPDYDFLNIRILLNDKVNHIIKLIESKSNDELYSTYWYKDYTAGRMIQLNTSSPYKNARKRIRKFIKESTSDHPK